MTVQNAYSTQELMQLLDVEVHTSILRRAKRENWVGEKRPGRGGGALWLLDSMPQETRLAIALALTEAQAKAAEATRCKHPVKSLATLPPSRRDKAEARAMVVQLAKSFHVSSRLARSAAYELFAIRYNAGEITAPAWVRETLPRVCRASIKNWQNTITTEGIQRLAGVQGQHRKGTGAMEQEYIRGFCIGHIYKFPHVEASGIFKDLRARLALEKRLERMPSLRRVQAWYKEWRTANHELFTFISNPDQWRSHYRVAFGDAAGLVDRLNQEWEMDSTPADLMLADGKRHTIVGCIDIYSRRLKFHVSRTSTSHAVATCFRKAVLDWGVPEIARTDNGADYVARHMERVLLDLGVLHDICDPFSPEQKPFIERSFRSLLHDICEVLPGFVGHNIPERKALEARKSFADRMMQRKNVQTVELPLTADELQQVCDRWANDTYMHQRHGGLGCTPYEQLLAYDGPVRRVEDAAALRHLFLPCVDGDGSRIVSKAGGVKVFSDEYLAPELALHARKRVQVRVDDADYGRVLVYSLDGEEFICEARGRMYSGMTQAEVKAVAHAATKLQRENLADRKTALAKAAKAANLDQIGYERMQADALRAREIEANQPLRAEVFDTHSTPALEGAMVAAQQPQPLAPTPVSEAEAAMQRIAAEALAPAQPAPPREETAADRYAWALRVEVLMKAGGAVSVADVQRLRNYQKTPEYDAQNRMNEFFGTQQVTNG